MELPRKQTRQLKLGSVRIGGGTFDAALTLDDQFKTSFVFEPRDTPRQGKRNKRK